MDLGSDSKSLAPEAKESSRERGRIPCTANTCINKTTLLLLEKQAKGGRRDRTHP